ncbi:MAG: hypothetical protein G01um10143_578 [Parcubacteria group bacterium Gr01-1014_3]|nr:MAG: hypothetical protein G01um10143_578 [Parcubacteria group bacterium Gr01-1014_3]
MKIALCFLTYNEAECLRKMLPGLDYSMFDDVFAVDGGSTDGSLEVYKQHGIRVALQKSRGRGEAFKFAEKSTDADAIVYFSPDGNEDPKDFPKFREQLEKGADIVIASRMMKGAFNEEDISWWRPRKWVNNLFTLAINILWNRSGAYITDSINGFRAIRRGLIEKLGQDAIGYTIEYQNTMRALQKNLKITEFPTREGQRLAGETKAHSLEVGIKFLKCLFQEIWLSPPWRLILPVLAAIFVGLVYILPPIFIRNHIENQGGSFLLVQPETYRDEFFSNLPKNREVYDGHFPPAGPYADDLPRTLLNPLPPTIFSGFLYLSDGDVNNAYLAMQFLFSAGVFLLLYALGLKLMGSGLWGMFLGFLGVFTHFAQMIFYYPYRDFLNIFVKDFIPLVRSPIDKLHIARIDDPLITLPVFAAALLAFYLFWKKPKFSTAAISAVLAGLLAYTYLHHWLVMMSIIGILFLLALAFYRQDKPRIKNFIFLLAITFVILIPYFVNNFSFLATYGEDFALRVGLEKGRDLAWKFLTTTHIGLDHIIYTLLLAAVYFVYFRWLKNKDKGIFFMACVLSMFAVWQIPTILGSIPQFSHLMKSLSLIALILIVNIIYDAHNGLGARGKKIVRLFIILLIVGMAGKKTINTAIFINPPAGVVEVYSFPKDILDSWKWIDENLGKEPKIVSSSLVTSLYLASNTVARPYLPTGFISTLPTVELEKRFLLVNKLFSVSPEILQRRLDDFKDGFQDRCFGQKCVHASEFNFTKTRWYLTEHGWHMTRMAKEPAKVIEEYKKMPASWAETNSDYIYYGPWEKQFAVKNFSTDKNLDLVYKNSLVEIYRIRK